MDGDGGGGDGDGDEGDGGGGANCIHGPPHDLRTCAQTSSRRGSISSGGRERLRAHRQSVSKEDVMKSGRGDLARESCQCAWCLPTLSRAVGIGHGRAGANTG
jgi:hypothetical protein